MKKNGKPVSRHIFLVFLAFFTLSLFSLKSLFHPGMYTAHDIWHNLARLGYYTSAINEGQFPPYFINSLANGFGYPLFVYSYHLPWLFAYPFTVWGLSDEVVIKMIFFVGYFLSGVSVYFLAYEFTRKKSLSLMSGFLYLWAPYRFFIIFVSASVGVSFSFMFVPLVFLGLLKISKDKRIDIGVMLLAAGFTGIILSHTATLFVLLPTLLIFTIVLFLKSGNKRGFFFGVLAGLLLCFGLSSFYLIPALYYRSGISGFADVYKMGFVSLRQLIYSKWGYGVIVQSASENPFSFQIGFAQWAVFLLSVVYLGFNYRNVKKNSLVFGLVLAFLINTLLMSSRSEYVWANFLGYTGIDFPFRFIYSNVLISSMLLPLVFIKMKPRLLQSVLLVMLIFMALYTNRNHLKVNMYLDKATYQPFVEAESTTNSYDEYLPKYIDGNLSKGENNEKILGQNGLELVSENTIYSQYRISHVDSGKVVVFPKYYYPYLHLYVNGNEVDQKLIGGGLISTQLSVKDGSLAKIKFEKSLIMKIADIESVTSLFVVLVFISGKICKLNVLKITKK